MIQLCPVKLSGSSTVFIPFSAPIGYWSLPDTQSVDLKVPAVATGWKGPCPALVPWRDGSYCPDDPKRRFPFKVSKSHFSLQENVLSKHLFLTQRIYNFLFKNSFPQHFGSRIISHQFFPLKDVIPSKEYVTLKKWFPSKNIPSLKLA